MKLLYLSCIFVAALAATPSTNIKGSYPYESVRNSNPKTSNISIKPASDLKTASSETVESEAQKKSHKIPSYAVPMEPLVKYSQRDPLLTENKKAISESKFSSKKGDLVRVKKQNFDEGIYPATDGQVQATYQQHHLAFPPPQAYYDTPYYEEPEPIIEIIIKESNQSLPAPPPPPLPKKKKKEPVQVFYVKYKKESSSTHHGGEKIVYEPPVPAITPPTNNANNHEEDEEEQTYQHHHYDQVTLPPRPSTTLKAIIKPDSETYHGSGIHITFGKTKNEDNGIDSNHHHHKGNYEDQSAPQPSIALPPRPIFNPPPPPKPLFESQLKKRNPTPFQSPTAPPQQSFHNIPQSNYFTPTTNSQFQQKPLIPPQHYKSQHSSQTRPVSPPLAYPGHPFLQSFVKPHQQSFSFFPRLRQPLQPVSQTSSATQQYFSINQPHLKSHFQISSRSTSPQPYHTISNKVTQQFSYSKAQPLPPAPLVPSFQQYPKPFSAPTRPYPQPTHATHPTRPTYPTHLFPQPTNPVLSQGNSFPQQNIPRPIQQGNVITSQRSHQLPILPTILPTQQHHVIQHQQPQQQQQSQIYQQPQQQPQLQQQSQIYQQPQQQPLDGLQRQQQIEQLNQLQRQKQVEQLNQLQRQKEIEEFNLRQRQQQIEQFNQLQKQKQEEQFRQIQQQQQLQQIQKQQQILQSQAYQNQHNPNLINQPQYQTTSAPEIIKSVSSELPFPGHRFDPNRHSTAAPHFQPTVRPVTQFTQQYTVARNVATTTESRKIIATTTTEAPVEYVTPDPKEAEEERKKKEERKKQNVAALPDEVPEDLRQQLLSSDILGNADIQILDYDKIGDIPIDKLPPEALANFQAVAGSNPVPAVAKPDFKEDDAIAEGSEQQGVVVPAPSDMEMKVVRYNPDSQTGAQVPNQYMQPGATQLDPVVLNDSKYNRYLPLKVSGAQFPVPDAPELRGKNITSVVVLAPVDYQFLQRHETVEDGRAGRASHPVLEVQGVHFIAGDVLKTLVKSPTLENYRIWLDKENRTAVDKQSVVLLVSEPTKDSPTQEKEIYMFDIGTQKVSKLSGELSAQFVEVAESNSENDDLEEISDSQNTSFTVKDTSEVYPSHVRRQRKAVIVTPKKSRGASDRR